MCIKYAHDNVKVGNRGLSDTTTKIEVIILKFDGYLTTVRQIYCSMQRGIHHTCPSIVSRFVGSTRYTFATERGQPGVTASCGKGGLAVESCVAADGVPKEGKNLLSRGLLLMRCGSPALVLARCDANGRLLYTLLTDALPKTDDKHDRIWEHDLFSMVRLKLLRTFLWRRLSCGAITSWPL